MEKDGSAKHFVGAQWLDLMQDEIILWKFNDVDDMSLYLNCYSWSVHVNKIPKLTIVHMNVNE